MSLVRACALADVPEDEALAVDVDGRHVAFARDGEEVFALDGECSHASISLGGGAVDGSTVECWLHGSCFDLRTGKPTGLPATQPLATFPVEVRTAADGTDDVYVDLTTTLNGATF